LRLAAPARDGDRERARRIHRLDEAPVAFGGEGVYRIFLQFSVIWRPRSR